MYISKFVLSMTNGLVSDKDIKIVTNSSATPVCTKEKLSEANERVRGLQQQYLNARCTINNLPSKI